MVLAGPSGSGKTTWAQRFFASSQVVSSDALRALVGEDERDRRAGTDAFDVLELVVARRLRRGLTTVVDSLGTDRARRRRWLRIAADAGVEAHCVVFDVDPEACRARNRARDRPVAPKALTVQLARWPAARGELVRDAFAAVHAPDDRVDLVPVPFVAAPVAAARQQEAPVPLEFGLQIPRFTWPGGPAEIAPRLGAIAAAAEEAGFTSIWVMDHFLQIPMAGREWDEMLDSYTTLGFLAAATRTARLGALVTGVTYRNVAHLGKIVATLDVLSGGRAMCGLGAAWFAREHLAYGWRFPPLRERYALLEDALELLPLLWGPGSPTFEGRAIGSVEAICYPRPLQDRVPIMVGGSGERVTLKLVAKHADACNLFGEADVVRRKVDVLRRHCDDVGRDPATVTVTQLSSVRVIPDGDDRHARDAATVTEHVGRFRELADAGVQTAIVNMPELGGTEPVERFADVIAAFRT